MTYRIAVLPGDGIGPEIMEAALLVLEETGVLFEWHMHDFGEKTGGTLPGFVPELIRNCHAAIKGPTATPKGEGHRSLNVQLREALQLYANIRPVKRMPVHTRFSDVPTDLVIVRENSEDLYIGREHEVEDGYVAEALFTKTACERIARFAFQYAVLHGRDRMIVGHKANIIKKAHGLFLETALKVAKEYPGITTSDLIADNLLMQLTMYPEKFVGTTLLLPNFLGDLVSDLAAGMIGGLGFAPGANIGDEHAVFEAVHGTAPDIAGKGIANPTALILSGAMMLDHLSEQKAAARVRGAVNAVLKRSVAVTRDVNPGSATSTLDYARAVARHVSQSL